MNIPIPVWVILAIVGACWAWGGTSAWLGDQYEVRRFRVTRRWYGSHARVCLRYAAGDEDADRYVVLCRDDENMRLPWLKVCKLNPDDSRYWHEDASPFWAPVTDFAPVAVRRVRPHMLRLGRVRLPWLTVYLPLRQPAGYLGGQP